MNQGQFNHETYSAQELKRTLQGIYYAVFQGQRSNLTAAISSMQSGLTQRFRQTVLPVRQKDDELFSILFEKCLLLKRQNQNLKIKILNIRATLIKLLGHTKNPLQRKDYEKKIEKIFLKSKQIKNKIQRYKLNHLNQKISHRKIQSIDIKRVGGEQLKKSTEWLYNQTIQLRRQFDIWKQYYQNRLVTRD